MSCKHYDIAFLTHLKCHLRNKKQRKQLQTKILVFFNEWIRTSCSKKPTIYWVELHKTISAACRWSNLGALAQLHNQSAEPHIFIAVCQNFCSYFNISRRNKPFVWFEMDAKYFLSVKKNWEDIQYIMLTSFLKKK